MGAPRKPALIQIGGELPEGVLQLLRPAQLHPLGVKGGEAGGVRHNGPGGEAEQLHMAGGVPPAPQLVGDLPHLEAELRLQGVEDAGLAHAGIARKGGNLAGNGRRQLRNALAGFSAHPQGEEAGLPVGLIQLLRRVQIALVDADHRLTVPALGDGHHPVDEKRIGHRHRAGGNHHQLVDVCHCRALELVLPGRISSRIPAPSPRG